MLCALLVAAAASVPVALAGNVTTAGSIAPLDPFSVPAPLPEGISLDPRTAVHVRIVFELPRRGSFTGRYEIRPDDGRGAHSITITGRGV